MGRGNVGWAVDEMPWGPDASVDKEFFLALIDTALRRVGWNRLGGAINEEFQVRFLTEFRSMIADHLAGSRSARD